MKLYTRSGDDGTTGLFGGERVNKDHPRVVAYGTVDELNAALGLACSEIDRLLTEARSDESARKTGMALDSPENSARNFLTRARTTLPALQSRMFDLGADLATPQGSKHERKVQRITIAMVSSCENWIDDFDSGNAPMTHFVLPGGTELAARLHLARTISRRAERAMLSLHHEEPINEQALILMNRVSDLLFAMARRANLEAGAKDVPWLPQ